MDMDKRLPKEIFIRVSSAGRRSCEFSVRLMNVLGAMASVLGKLAKIGVNVLS
jgi:hypothetical protein